MQLKCRKADVPDKPLLVDFQLKMAKETEKLELNLWTVEHGVEKILRDPSIGHYLVCEVNSKIVASTLILKEWSDWRNGEVWWIHSVYVLPDFRRRGVFRKIYETVKSEVMERSDLRGLRLYVEKHNKIAQTTYSNLGMTDDRYSLFEWMKDF